MTPFELIDKVRRFTDENSLIPANSTLLVGVSGGADSMVLLDIMTRRRAEGLRLTAVHVHHGIRGEEADRDEAFVREQCALRRVPLTVVRVDVPSIAAAERMGLEEAGRTVRYAIFRRLREEYGAAAILTAHTASDRTETVLLHILRGCGVSGLYGIAASRDGIVRPLLTVTRAEIEEYCAAVGLPYVCDSTNTDTAYSRNAVRCEVMPILRRMNPSAEAAILRLADSAAADEAFLRQTAARALDDARLSDRVFRVTAFREQPACIAYRMLRLALEELGCRSAEEKHIRLIEGYLQSGGGVMLPGGFAVRVTADRLEVSAGSDPLPMLSEQTVDTLPFTLATDGFEAEILVREAKDSEEAQNVHKMFFKYAIDYDKIQGGLMVRGRRQGDRLHPAGRQIGKSVRDVMSERRMPVRVRDVYPLLCDDKGILLIPGVTCDERVRTDDRTRHFLVWRWRKEPS